jgi:CDP-glucose 4,6-dehydratase
VEGLVVSPVETAFTGRRIFVTGHTGFKGSWLALWLTRAGAKVFGYALEPPPGHGHFRGLSLPITDLRGDIRDAPALHAALRACDPELVFHLAAQPLVRASYAAPIETWSTNVVGTAQVLDACRGRGVRGVVVVTTDKCYENREWCWPYRESDPLGGRDPYSASKAGTELVAASYRASFFTDRDDAIIATARAGNVIGGGDFSEDRLVPDVVRATMAGTPLEIRSPHAVRPWQHVLDSLHGYLKLGARMLAGDRSCGTAWNFGPEEREPRSVEAVLRGLRTTWPNLAWSTPEVAGPHEASALRLDSSKARAELGFRSTWDFSRTLAMTGAWYREYVEGGRVISIEQLDAFRTEARTCP